MTATVGGTLGSGNGSFPDRHAGLGPFKSSGGNFYAMMRSLASVGQAIPITSSVAGDPMQGWEGRPTKTMSSATTTSIQAMACYQVGDVIHVATQISTGAVYYNNYNMSTDAWGLSTSEVAVAAASFAPTTAYTFLSLVVRSNGNVVIGYCAGLTAMSSGFNMVRYRERTAVNTYSTATNVDNGGSNNWSGPTMVLGASDRVHFTLTNVTTGFGYQRTLSAANALQTFPSSSATANSATAPHCVAPGVSYVDAGTTRVRFPFYGTSTESGSPVGRERLFSFDSADSPTVSMTGVSDVVPLSVNSQWNGFLVNDSTTLHYLYSASSDSDLYHDVNSGAGWGTDVNELAGTINRITANVYDRSGTKLAMVLDNGGTVTYAEISLVTGPATVTGAATLSGSGALSGAGTRIRSGTAALTGTGTLSATGSRLRQGAAALAGTGALSATGTRVFKGAAALAGTGSVAATGTRIRSGTASLAGTGTLAATGAHTGIGAASVNGTGALSANGTRIRSGASALSGSGALAATGVAQIAGAASLSGSGTLSASGTRIRSGAVAFTGTGTLAATGAHIAIGTASISGTGTLSASGTRLRQGASDLAGSGVLSASGTIVGGFDTVTGAADLAGSGALAVSGTRIVAGASSLTGTGTLSATGARIRSGAANLTGAGALEAAGAHTAIGAASLSGSGALSASATRAAVGAASLTGSGILSATSDAGIKVGSVALSGSGVLAATGTRIVAGAVPFSGTGGVLASGALLRTGITALSGSGSLSAAGTRIRFTSAALSGTGTLSAAGRRASVGAGALTGAGSISATGAYIAVGVVALSGEGILWATSSALLVSGASALSGAGVLGAWGHRLEETPVARTFLVDLEGRGYEVPLELRALAVAQETREADAMDERFAVAIPG